MCCIIIWSSGCGFVWRWGATEGTGVGEIGGQRTILEFGEDPPSTSMSTWAVWGLIKRIRSHHIVWIGSSMSGSWWSHGMTTCPKYSSQVGSNDWINQWLYGKISLVQDGQFSPGIPIPLGKSGTPYAVTYQWCRLKIDQRREGGQSFRGYMDQLVGWWCVLQRHCLSQGMMWW